MTDPAVADRFRATIGRGHLGPTPWDGLAAALTEDVTEADMADWPAFERPAEGATAAPAPVFIDRLACRYKNRHYRSGLPKPPRYYASDLMKFCCLVHSPQNLAKQAGARGRPVTVPQPASAEFGLDRDNFANALAAGDLAALDGLVRVHEGLHDDFCPRCAARIEQLPDLEAGHRAAAFAEP